MLQRKKGEQRDEGRRMSPPIPSVFDLSLSSEPASLPSGLFLHAFLSGTVCLRAPPGSHLHQSRPGHAALAGLAHRCETNGRRCVSVSELWFVQSTAETNTRIVSSYLITKNTFLPSCRFCCCFNVSKGACERHKEFCIKKKRKRVSTVRCS